MEEVESVIAVGPIAQLPASDRYVKLESEWITHEPDPSAAIDALEAGDFSCLLVASELPERDEIEYVEEIAEIDPAVQVVYCSENTSKSTAAIEAGAADCLSVDAGSELLEHRIEQLLERETGAVTASRKQIKSLHDVGVDLARCNSKDEVYEIAVQAGKKILDLDICAIGIVENGKFRLCEASDSLPEDGYHEPRIDSPEGGHAVKVYRTGEAILTDDMQDAPDANPLLDYRGAMTAPIGDFGVYQAVSYEVGAFDETDLELTEILISHITEAIKRLENEHRLQCQQEQIEQLHSVGIELAACDSATAVYETVVEAAERILYIERCAFGVVRDGQIVSGAMSSKLSPESCHSPPIDDESAGIAGKCFRTGDSILTVDIQESEIANPADPEFQSALTVPVGKYGVFQAVSDETGAFSETDLNLTKILAKHAREALSSLEQRERLEKRSEQLARENERLDEFTSIVSHDLRNPLNVAALQLELVSEEFESERIETAMEALDRTQTLISDLLALAREGETVSEFDTVRLDRVTRRAWQHVETGSATVTLQTKASIEADRSRLQQLLSNLFRNAVEHGCSDRESGSEQTDENLKITVGMLDNGFYVEDNGIGIPDEIRSEIFQHGVSKATDSMGIGLAIVRRIAEAHDWSIRAEKSDSGGARFEITDVDQADDR